MKCWKCEQENVQDASRCIYCNTDLKRTEPESEIGKALRQMYNHYGAESLLTNQLLMVNGLGDLTQDSGKFRSQLKMALDAGIGKLYLDQIRSVGHPDPVFEKQIAKILSEDAELSDSVIQKITKALDEMIGWSKKEDRSPSQKTAHSEQPENAVLSDSAPSKKRPIVLQIIIFMLLLSILIIVIGSVMFPGKNGISLPLITSSPSSTQAPIATPVSETPTTTPTKAPTPTPIPATPAPVTKDYYPDGAIKSEYDYDSAGTLIQKTEYLPDGKINRICNAFDQNMNVLKYTQYNTEKKGRFAQSYYTCTYDKSGNLLTKLYSLPDGTVMDYSVYEYNTQGYLIKEIVYDQPDGQILSITVFTYDTQGNKTKETINNYLTLGTEIIEYNKQEKANLHTYYFPDGTVDKIETLYLNENDLCDKMITEKFRYGGSTRYENQYTYYPNNQKKSDTQKQYKKDKTEMYINNIKLFDEYGNVISDKDFSPNGSEGFSSEWEYTYNNEKQCIQYNYHIKEETVLGIDESYNLSNHYNADGLLVSEISAHSDGTPHYTHENEYNNKGILIKEKRVFQDNHSLIWSYNNRGILLNSEYYNPDGTLNYITTYSPYGSKVKSSYYKADGKTLRLEEIYDEYDTYVRKNTYINGILNSYTLYDYDTDGNRTETEYQVNQ